MKSTSILQLVAKGLACHIFPNQGWKLFKSHSCLKLKHFGLQKMLRQVNKQEAYVQCPLFI